MMRSMYSGVTGLRNHQTRMDVIGNNISNVNTVGYKYSRLTFQDIYSQTTKSASAANGTVVGGTNPQQIGLGVKVGSIDVMHTPAAAQYTGRALDLAIEGEGFFIIQRDGQEFYTRAGNFYTDAKNNLVTTNGDFVIGYSVFNKPGTPPVAPVVVDLNGAAKLTGATMTVGSGIGTGTNQNKEEHIQVTGSDLTNMTLQYKGQTIQVDLSGTGLATLAGTSNTNLQFGDYGTMTLTIGATAFTTVAEASAAVNTVKFTYSGATDRVQGQPGTTLGNIVIDPSYYEVSIDKNGNITGLDRDTGLKYTIGVIPIATFANQEALEKVGSSLYRVSANSGKAVYNVPGQNGVGLFNPGALEMSNVDLADSFTDMIVTQRGFQANSRVITTSDTMLEELVNLKR